MTHQMILASGVEVLLMSSTFILLSTAGVKAFHRWAGTILLCLTFCWSVVLGCVIALNDLTFRI